MRNKKQGFIEPCFLLTEVEGYTTIESQLNNIPLVFDVGDIVEEA
ncbi:MAG: hypothetical protein PHT88_01700 [Candidatus Moranbacteria bacterium]|nr:hypothetical protein [Candidatus Moranbacteria bacterium]